MSTHWATRADSEWSAQIVPLVDNALSFTSQGIDRADPCDSRQQFFCTDAKAYETYKDQSMMYSLDWGANACVCPLVVSVRPFIYTTQQGSWRRVDLEKFTKVS